MNTRLSISLPAPLKKWIDQQVSTKGYPTADAFVLEMLRREKALEAREKVEEILAQALSEGTPASMTRSDWEEIRSKGAKLAREQRRK
jgi:Arc/MetJ-type ribon-helix-helix transcriptional regulator